MNNYLLEKLILPIGDKAIGGEFIHWLNKHRSLLSMSASELQEHAAEKLDAVLQHTAKNVPYYQKYFADKNIDPSQVNLKDFPILEKQVIRDHIKELVTMPESQLIKHSSSGSSGFQTSVYWSKREQSIHRATQILWWEWAGYKIGDPILQTGLSFNRTLLKSIKDKLFNTYYMLAFSHTKEDVKEALVWASKQKQPTLAGYASSLYVLSQIALELGIKVKFKTAISWGDKLFDHYRASIEKAFGCKVYETYATAEGLMIAAQKDLDYLYQLSTHTKLEIVDDNGNEVEDGQLGHVVVTNLNAYAMPLIRFRIGDLAIKLPESEKPANAALGFPCLAKVIGRDTDIVKTKGGKRLIVHSFTGIFEYVPEIKQFCVIQENLEGVKIKYIPATGFKEELLIDIREKILSRLDESFEIEFIKVDEIPPTPSGKPQIIVSKLK